MPDPASGHAGYWLCVWEVGVGCSYSQGSGQALRGLMHSEAGEAKDSFVPS